MNRYAAAALAFLLGFACVSTNHAVRPGGDFSKITLKDRTSFRAELLGETQTEIYFMRDQRVWRYPSADITSIYVEGYSLRRTKCLVLGVFGVVDVALCAGALTSGFWRLVPLAAATLAASAITSLDDEPPIDFRIPSSDFKRARLALHCRYPQGLTDAQWQELLRFYHQDEFLGPGDSAEASESLP